MTRRRALMALAIGVAATAVNPHNTWSAGPADRIVGIWWSPLKDGKIEIHSTPAGYAGRIIAGRPDRKDRRDTENPDPALQSRRLIGATILAGFKFDGKEQWDGGTIYDPESGTTYRARLWLENPNRLMVRGFVGIDFLGRTETFERVTGPAPHTPQTGEPTLTHLGR